MEQTEEKTTISITVPSFAVTIPAQEAEIDIDEFVGRLTQEDTKLLLSKCLTEVSNDTAIEVIEDWVESEGIDTSEFSFVNV